MAKVTEKQSKRPEYGNFYDKNACFQGWQEACVNGPTHECTNAQMQ